MLVVLNQSSVCTFQGGYLFWLSAYTISPTMIKHNASFPALKADICRYIVKDERYTE